MTSLDRGRDICTADLSSGVMWVESKNTNLFRSPSLWSAKKPMRAALVIGWCFFKNGSVRKGQGMAKAVEERDRERQTRMNLRRPWQKPQEMF